MRLRLTLQHEPGIALPIDYRYALSSWIYRTIASADSEFGKWLHEQGYQIGTRRFKLFTYGLLRPERFDARGGTFYLTEGPTRLDVSFYVPAAIQNLISGVFTQQRFHLGSRDRPVYFQVSELHTLPTPEIVSPLELDFITPLCISKGNPDRRTASYLAPDHPEFGERLFKNLRNKWYAHAAHDEAALAVDPNSDLDFKWDFEVLSDVRERLHRIKNHRVRGYEFSCRLSGPAPLLTIGYLGGFGSNCSALGYGMTWVK